MGRVVRAVVSIGASIVGAAIGFAIGGPIGATIGAALFSAGARALMGTPGGPRRAAAAATLQIGEQPRQAIFGRAAVSGSLVDAFNYGGKYGTDWEVLVIAVADHRCDALEGFFVDDRYIAFTGDGNVAGFNNQLQVFWRSGTWSQTVPAILTTNGPGWTANNRGRGVAYVVVAYKADDEKAKNPVWPSGRPRFRWVVRGLRCYQARKDSTVGGSGAHRWNDPATWQWTENPIDIAHNWRRGIYAGDLVDQPGMLLIGRGLSAIEAPPANVFARANLCDELVGGQPRYRIGGVAASTEPFIDVEGDFAAACAGVISQPEGAVEVDPGEAKAAVAHFTDADLIVGSKVRWNEGILGQQDASWLNTVVARYVEPAQRWAQHSAPVLRDLADITADRAPREQQLALDFVTNGAQAQRVGEIFRRFGRLWGRATVTLPPRFAFIEEGDWVTWQSDRRFGGATLTFRVEAWGSDQAWHHQLTLRQISASVFSDTAPLDDGSIASNQPEPPVVAAPGVGAWALASVQLDGGGLRVPALRVTGATDDPAAQFVVFEYVQQIAAPTAGTQWTFASSSRPDVTRFDIPVTAGGTFWVAVSYVVDGILGDRRFLGPITTGLVTYPDGTPVQSLQPAEAGGTRNVARGTYDAGTTYLRGDEVIFSGSTYRLIVESSTGNSPPDVLRWALVAQAGAGPAGADGLPGISVLVSNEAHVVATAQDGSGGDYSGAGGQMLLLRGDVLLSPTFSIAAASPATSWITINATTGVYTVSDPGVDVATATLRATWAGVNYDRTYTLAKSKAGVNGAQGPAGPTLLLLANAQAFTFTDGAAIPASQTITLTAQLSGISGTATFTTTPSVTLGGTGNTRTLSVEDFGANRQVTIEATLGGITDRMTLVRVDRSTGALAAQDAASWRSQIDGRPAELTDGRIPSGLRPDGSLQSGVWGGANSIPALQLLEAGLVGKRIARDPDFAQGNPLLSYNNTGSGAITLARIADNSAPNGTGHIIRVSYDGVGPVNPDFGGVTLLLQHATASRPGFYAEGTKVVYVIRAKIPAGRGIAFATNIIGNGGTFRYLTNMAGTGAWQTYMVEVTHGIGGTLGSTGFFHIYGGPNTAFSWDIALADCREIGATDVPSLDRLADSTGTFRGDTQLITAQGTAAAITGQGSLATRSTVEDGFISGALANRVAPHPLNSAALRADTMAYLDGTFLPALRPAEANANVTETRTAAAITGQGALATRSNVSWTSADVINRPLVSAQAITADETTQDPTIWSVPASNFINAGDHWYIRAAVGEAISPIGTFASATPIDPNATYEAYWEILEEGAGTPDGRFYTVVIAYDAAGNVINGDGTFWFYPQLFIAVQARGVWNRYSARFGRGTARPFPTNAVKFHVGVLLNHNLLATQPMRARRFWARKIESELFVVGGSQPWTLADNSAVRLNGPSAWAIPSFARSKAPIVGPQSFYAQPVGTGGGMMGLTTSGSAESWPSLAAAMYFTGSSVEIYSNGGYVNGFSGFGNPDALSFRIDYDGVNFLYYINGALVQIQVAGANQTYYAFVESYHANTGFRAIRHESSRAAAVIGSNTFNTSGGLLSSGALVTAEGTAAAIAGQGALATLNNVSLSGGNVTGILPADRADSLLQNTGVVLSGTLAARPASGTFVGQTYTATDTREFFRWNGSSWAVASDVTQSAQITFTTPSPFQIQADSSGVTTTDLSTQTRSITLLRGGVAQTSGVTVGTPTANPSAAISVASATVSGGIVTVTLAAANASGSVTIPIIFGGVTYPVTIPVNRTIAPPPSGGSGDTLFSDGSWANISTTTYTQVTDSGATVRSTSGGQLSFGFSAQYNRGNVQCKAQYSLDGTTWSDVAGTETTGTAAITVPGEEEPGSISRAPVTQSSLAASTLYFVRLVARRTGGTGTISWIAPSFTARQP